MEVSRREVGKGMSDSELDVNKSSAILRDALGVNISGFFKINRCHDQIRSRIGDIPTVGRSRNVRVSPRFLRDWFEES